MKIRTMFRKHNLSQRLAAGYRDEKRRCTKWLLSTFALVACFHAGILESKAQGVNGRAAPFMANRVKIGEVTSTSAILWTRLTTTEDYRTGGEDFAADTRGVQDSDPRLVGPEHGYGGQVPDGKTLAEMNTSVPGMAGDVRLSYWPTNAPDQRKSTRWTAVDTVSDFTRQFLLRELTPQTRYGYLMEGRAAGGSRATVSVEGAFSTAAAEDTPSRVVFTVVTGSRWQTRDDEKNGQKIYPQMAAIQPSFFVHTGDIVYYDSAEPFVTHSDLARFKWNRMYALPFVRDFHQQIPSYFIKDDHDSWQNDDWPTMNNFKMGQFTWEHGRRIFLEQVPMGGRTYRTIRWGKDLQVWLVEGRDFRSANDAPDGPDKTIWGKQQMAWFQRTVTESDATFRVLISPTPIVGPDHMWKAGTVDNHVAEGRAYEGTRLREFLGKQKNLFVVCGDRHWQYASQDPKTGVREYACGPTTDKHATEIQNENLEIVKYIQAKGGFLSVTIDRDGQNIPTATFRHHGVSGQVYHEDAQRVSQ